MCASYFTRPYFKFALIGAISHSATQQRNHFSACFFVGTHFFAGTRSHVFIFVAPCRLIPNVSVGQMCPKALLYFCANLRTFSPHRVPDQTVGSEIKWMSGPFSSVAA